jgi:hypothetical protein
VDIELAELAHLLAENFAHSFSSMLNQLNFLQQAEFLSLATQHPVYLQHFVSSANLVCEIEVEHLSCPSRCLLLC